MVISQQNLASGFQRHTTRLNAFDPKGRRRLAIAGQEIGWLGQKTADVLVEAGLLQSGAVCHLLQADDADPQTRTKALVRITQLLVDQGLMGDLRGEIYRVCEDWEGETLATIDRRAIAQLGLPSFGVHVNGVVRTKTGIEMWIATRALDREVEPGKLDNMIGGGQPADLSLMENVIKEAEEEANVPADLAAEAKQVAVINYCHSDGPERVKNDTIYAYDLWLPESFEPQNTDGEVERFERLPVAEVASLVCDTDRFKPNCNLVIIDFLKRHDPALLV